MALLWQTICLIFPLLRSASWKITNHQQWRRHFSRVFWIKRYFFIEFGRAIVNALGGPQPQAFWHFLIHLAGGAIANHLSAWRGLNCRPEQVLITSGAWEALEINFYGILLGDRNVAIEGTGWRAVRKVLGATKTEMFPTRINKKGFGAGRIPSGLSAAIVTPCRHYPTGIVMPLSR